MPLGIISACSTGTIFLILASIPQERAMKVVVSRQDQEFAARKTTMPRMFRDSGVIE